MNRRWNGVLLASLFMCLHAQRLAVIAGACLVGRCVATEAGEIELPFGVIVRIGLAADQVGWTSKECLKARFVEQGHAVEDVCPEDAPRSYYQSVTDQLALAICAGRVERGVLICAGAIGASVAANKHPGVRAALCHELYSARHGVQDDAMNLLVMGACVVSLDLACELADTFIQASNVPREQAFGIPPRRLARVLEHIRNNLDQSLAVSVLSRLAEMSQSHFSKLFKLSTGLAPHQFVLQERINRSKQLLRQGDARIVDVALGVGFENQAHFTTVFGNFVGMTPRQFQRSSDSEADAMFGPPAAALLVRAHFGGE
jgi:RpiB/LacA/LacB family sugar-phosphate isomerase